MANYALCGSKKTTPVGSYPLGASPYGAMDMSGEEGEPRKFYVHFVDYFSAAIAALGIVAALYARHDTRRGAAIHTSLLGSALAMMNSVLAEEAALKPGRRGTGNRAQTAAPADVFATLDGRIILQVIGDSKFADLARLIDQPQLADDPALRGDNARGEHALIINKHVAKWCGRQTTDECIAALDAAGLCASPILTGTEALGHPQARQHGSRFDVKIPENDRTIPLFLPLEYAARAPQAAPTLGSHSREILAECGYSATDIADFECVGVIRSAAATPSG